MGIFKKKFTDEEVKEKIELCKSVHNNKYSYDKVVYVDYDTKVIITCPTHGDYEQVLYNHSKGRGCKKCSNEDMSKLMRKDKDDFVNKSNLVHNYKYSYDKVPDSFKVRSKVTVTCPIHGDFKQVAYSHKNGTGCSYCSGGKGDDKEKGMKIKEENLNKLIQKIHGNDVKIIYLPDKTSDKYIFNCRHHGEIIKNYGQICKGQVCGKCLLIRNRKRNSENHIKKMKKIHKDRFDYINLPEIVDSDTIIKIKCKEHGNVFEMKKVFHITSKYGGCDDCVNQYKETNLLEQSEIIDRFILVHDNRYSYDKVVYNGSTEKVIITCPKHGDFGQTPSSHIRGSGCPKCKDTTGEKLIQSLLKKMNISYTTQKTFYGCNNDKTDRMLPFDIYVPEFHTCIEYDGYQHFIPVERWGGEETLKDTQYRDEIKNRYCKENDINLIRIPYTTDKTQIVDILNKNFNKDLVVTINKRTKWVDTNVREEVKKYKNRSEFRLGSPGLYMYCKKNKILDDVCAFMGFKHVPYTYERAKEITQKIDVYTILERDYGGLVQYIKKHGYEHLTEHMIKKRTLWTKEEVLEELKNYTYRTELRENGGLYKAVVRYGLMNTLKNKTTHWNKEMVVEVFKKCSSKTEVKIKYRGAENYAKKHDLYNELCKYFIKK